MLIEEQFDELQTELDTLRNEHSNASKDISLKNFNIDQLTDELNQVKKILNEREREVSCPLIINSIFTRLYILAETTISFSNHIWKRPYFLS